MDKQESYTLVDLCCTLIKFQLVMDLLEIELNKIKSKENEKDENT